MKCAEREKSELVLTFRAGEECGGVVLVKPAAARACVCVCVCVFLSAAFVFQCTTGVTS